MTKFYEKIRLSLFGLPSIETIADFSLETHLSKGLIYRLSRFADRHYFTYKIPKKNGGERIISQPNTELKALQVWILRNILNKLIVSASCKGFEKNTNIYDNAEPHIGALAVMCLDIDDFFPSIKVNQVWSVFRAAGYNPRVASILASICTFNGGLPQGSPASPKIANLVCLRLDARITGYVGRRGITYTRYADDLTFSAYSYTTLFKAHTFIRKIVKSEGFNLNRDKTRLAGASRRHKITGLIVNDNEAGIGRVRMRWLRSKINHLCEQNNGNGSLCNVEQIKGWLAFISSVDEKRRNMLDEYIKEMRIKYPSSPVCLLTTLENI